MAVNSARGNNIAATDGPSGPDPNPPPPVAADTKAALRREAERPATAEPTSGAAAAAAAGGTVGATGVHASGQDAEAEPPGATVETVEEVEGVEKQAGRRSG